jgi:hypothetical protein
MAYAFAVVLDGDELASWQAETVRMLESQGWARLASIIEARSASEGAGDARSGVHGDSSYEAFVRRAGVAELLAVKARALFAGCQWLDCASAAPAGHGEAANAGRTAAGAGPEGVEAAAHSGRGAGGADVGGAEAGGAWDFILGFTSRREVPAEIAAAARYGVWQFVYGDPASFEAAVPAFWEVLEDHDVTGAALVHVQSGGNLGVVLKQAHLATQRTSFADNAALLLREMQTWPARVCRDLAAGAAVYFNALPQPRPPRRYGVPAAHDIRTLQARARARTFAHIWRRRFLKQDWTIALADRYPSDFVEIDARPQVRVLAPYDRTRFLADCFVAGRDGKTFVFFEDFDYRRGRGVIGVAPLDGRGPLRARTALEEPHHLSYPQVFEHGGTFYCLPESVYARVVRLYRAVEFPYRWEPAATLVEDFAAVDPTLVFFEGRWWLFCTNLDEGYHSHLYVWYAGDLFGPWQQHAANPVKVDVRSAGPAGPLFVHQGVLYRPAQDCSRVYGGCIRLNRIERLTTHEFKEVPAGTIRPPRGPYSQGLHTIAAWDGTCVVDVMRYVFNPQGALGLVRGWAGSLARGAGVPDESLAALKARLRAWRGSGFGGGRP